MVTRLYNAVLFKFFLLIFSVTCGIARAAATGSVLPADLSPWGMFIAADLVVKSVIIGLVLASVLTWAIFVTKWIELTVAKAVLRKTARTLAMQTSIDTANEHMSRRHKMGRLLVTCAREELGLSQNRVEKDGIKERVRSRLSRIEANASKSVSAGTGILATIGSTAPFVGLFGTVWGIMNSFIGISKSQTTNLAVVAPGIAEALLATAVGLVAAIPAVIVYNYFARSIAGYRALVTDLSEEVARIVSRDLDNNSGSDAEPSFIEKQSQGAPIGS